jgi:hypothetical protein
MAARPEDVAQMLERMLDPAWAMDVSDMGVAPTAAEREAHWAVCAAYEAQLFGTPFSGTAVDDAEIRDTPLDEWNAGVDVLLAECAQWQGETDTLRHQQVTNVPLRGEAVFE